MVLADTSVWVEHLRRGEARLAALLEEVEVLCHPFVIGEIACGQSRNRSGILDLLRALPSVDRAGDDELLEFIERNRLQGKGLGLVGGRQSFDLGHFVADSARILLQLFGTRIRFICAREIDSDDEGLFEGKIF